MISFIIGVLAGDTAKGKDGSEISPSPRRGKASLESHACSSFGKITLGRPSTVADSTIGNSLEKYVSVAEYSGSTVSPSSGSSRCICCSHQRQSGEYQTKDCFGLYGELPM